MFALAFLGSHGALFLGHFYSGGGLENFGLGLCSSPRQLPEKRMEHHGLYRSRDGVSLLICFLLPLFNFHELAFVTFAMRFNWRRCRNNQRLKHFSGVCGMKILHYSNHRYLKDDKMSHYCNILVRISLLGCDHTIFNVNLEIKFVIK